MACVPFSETTNKEERGTRSAQVKAQKEKHNSKKKQMGWGRPPGLVTPPLRPVSIEPQGLLTDGQVHRGGAHTDPLNNTGQV